MIGALVPCPHCSRSLPAMPDAQGVLPEQQAKSRKFYKVATSFELSGAECLLSAGCAATTQPPVLDPTKKDHHHSEVLKSLQVTRAVLEKYEDRDGPKLQKLNQKLELVGVPLMKSGNSTSFLASCHLTKIGNSTSFQAFNHKLVEGLRASLDRRLDDVGVGVLKSSILAAFSSSPHKDSSKDFGNDWLDDLSVHFEAVLESA